MSPGSEVMYALEEARPGLEVMYALEEAVAVAGNVVMKQPTAVLGTVTVLVAQPVPLMMLGSGADLPSHEGPYGAPPGL